MTKYSHRTLWAFTMWIKRNITVQKSQFRFFFSFVICFAFSSKRFIPISRIQRNIRFWSVCVCIHCYRNYHTINEFDEFDRRFLACSISQSDRKERVRMRPAVTLRCTWCCVIHARSHFVLCSVLVFYYLLLFFHSCSMPFVFLSFFLTHHPHLGLHVRSYKLHLNMPVFCRFHLHSQSFSLFRSTMIYCTS